MKEQYVGDLNDYRKYALLRALAAGGANRIAVCWMLTPPDDRNDGNKRAYLDQPEKHRSFDPALFDVLRSVEDGPGVARLRAIENSGIIPGATYFNEELPRAERDRAGFMTRCRLASAGSDLVFFDPDNGLEVKSTAKGRAGSERYLFLDEAAAFYAAGHSLLIYQHFGRVEREAFIAGCAERLLSVAPGAAFRAFRTGHVVFLLLIHPTSPESLSEAAEAAATGWRGTDFVWGHTPEQG